MYSTFSELVGLLALVARVAILLSLDLPVILLVHGVEHECRELSGVEGLLLSFCILAGTAKTT